MKMTKQEKYEQRQQKKAAKAEKERAERELRSDKQRKTDLKYMKSAITQAKRAYSKGEVPIGCVIVRDGKIIGRGYNRRNTDNSTLSHAEITAIRKASKELHDWRLDGCTLYVTLEPCQMCAGAIVQARISRVVMAADNPKAGCGGSIINLLQMDQFMHKAEVERGIMKEEASELLSRFFVFFCVKKGEEQSAQIKNDWIN